MGVNIEDVLDAVVSHAMSLGVFERVNTHEPKNAPGYGLTCAIWAQDLIPIRASGLNSTSVRIAFTLRLYQNMLSEPQDAIDPNLIAAADLLCAEYTNDFQLGGDISIRMVDLLGAHGIPGPSWRAGFDEQDSKMFRVMDINLPLVINDVWQQTAQEV
jgi:hypothetical protein